MRTEVQAALAFRRHFVGADSFLHRVPGFFGFHDLLVILERGKIQAAFHFVGAMAFETMLLQNRFNLLFEILRHPGEQLVFPCRQRKRDEQREKNANRNHRLI